MTGRAEVRVLCPDCRPPRLLCTVTGAARQPGYAVPIGKGWDTGCPGGVWCPAGHGWPDLGGKDVARGLARARAAGGTVTLRARRMLPYAPAPR